jgi:succinyl-CoA synthetase beta subunit
VFDRSAKKPMAMLSRMGGMDVEEVAERDPEAMRMLHVDPLIGFRHFHGRRLAYEAGIAGDLVRPVGTMLGRLYDVFESEDATLVEVNPLLVTSGREMMAPTRRSRSTATRSTATRTSPSSGTSRPRTRRSGRPRSAD